MRAESELGCASLRFLPKPTDSLILSTSSELGCKCCAPVGWLGRRQRVHTQTEAAESQGPLM